jgi:hypothetical protein
LWLHVTLYRLTNGRIGGRFIAGTPILLLTTRRAIWQTPQPWALRTAISSRSAPHAVLVPSTVYLWLLRAAGRREETGWISG